MSGESSHLETVEMLTFNNVGGRVLRHADHFETVELLAVNDTGNDLGAQAAL